jgi:hypothetical protein
VINSLLQRLDRRPLRACRLSCALHTEDT